MRAAPVLLALIASLGTGGCGLVMGTEVRYKVTVEVQDGTALRKGSSVWSWRLSRPAAALATPYNGKFQGEAVAVEIGTGNILFAVLRGAAGDEGAASMLPERLFGDIGRVSAGERPLHSPDRIADLKDIASRQGEQRTLDCGRRPEWCPMLITFADTGAPETVSQVDAANLETAFGPHVRLKRISVEVTHEPVTRGIERKLPWLAHHVGTLIRRPRSVPIGDLPPAGRLNKGDFRRLP